MDHLHKEKDAIFLLGHQMPEDKKALCVNSVESATQKYNTNNTVVISLKVCLTVKSSISEN